MRVEAGHENLFVRPGSFHKLRTWIVQQSRIADHPLAIERSERIADRGGTWSGVIPDRTRCEVSTVPQMLFDRLVDVSARYFSLTKLRMEQLSFRSGLSRRSRHPSAVPMFRDPARSTQVRPGMTPGRRNRTRQCSGAKSAHFPPTSGRKGARQSAGQSIQSFASRTAPRARRTFLSLALRQRAKPHVRRLLLVLSEFSRREHDADRLLHALEDAGRHVRLVALRRAVDHPDVRAGPAQVVAHLLEARPVEKAGDGDETDDAFFVRIRHAGRGEAAGAEDLQRRPAPEIDVEVPQVLAVRADAPIGAAASSGRAARGACRRLPFSIQPPRPSPSPCRADCR